MSICIKDNPNTIYNRAWNVCKQSDCKDGYVFWDMREDKSKPRKYVHNTQKLVYTEGFHLWCTQYTVNYKSTKL